MDMSWLMTLMLIVGGIIVAAIAVIGAVVFLFARGSGGRRPE